jgi:hypothetical protein
VIWALASLSLVVVLQQLFYMRLVDRLTNKLMSRNFYDFQVSEKVLKPKKKEQKMPKEDTDTVEDLGHLSDIG